MSMYSMLLFASVTDYAVHFVCAVAYLFSAAISSV